MILVESEEHDALRSALRTMLAREAPLTKSVADSDDPRGYDRALWRRLASELGIAGLSVPAQFGGSGATVQEEAILAAELGSSLACTPYLATMALGANLLLASDNGDASAQYLPSMTTAALTAAVAVRGRDGSLGPHQLSVTARQDGGSWVLNGTAGFVIDGHSADLLLVCALIDRDVALFAVEADAAGLARRRLQTMDHLRPIAELNFEQVPAQLITRDRVWSAVEHTLDLATVALAAEQTACAELVLAQTVAYSKVRVQFARPIGSFQAIKHRCADTAVSNDRARSAVEHAVWAAVADADRLPAAAAMAALVCGPAFQHAAEENVQLHGGIGFTWEHPAHRYFRRATSDLSLLADRRWYEDRLLTAVGVETPRAI